MKPIRVQRKRTKGWKMPPNTVYVGRPTKWGNPYRIEDKRCTKKEGAKLATCLFSLKLENINLKTGGIVYKDLKKELRGKNLACFCPLDQPCHADVLLKLANR